MDTLRSLAHLQREIGDELFQILISSDNTGKVKNFCDQLLKDAMFTSMTVGDRTYDILGFLRGDEKFVVGHTVAERAKEMSAHLGEDDGQYLLDNQQDIPVALQGKVVFVFTDWREPFAGCVACVYWYNDRWGRVGYWLDLKWGDDEWNDNVRVLRRKKDSSLKKQLGFLITDKLKLEGSPCQRLVPHLIPDWLSEIVEDVEPTIVEGATLLFPDFMQGKEPYTDGPTMRKRAVEMVANKGLSDVPALLGPDGKGLKTIPAELRGYACIVLTGTVLRDSNGSRCVPCLHWDRNEWWYLGFFGLVNDWGGNDRLVSCE